tara:strand:- start:18 stop:899 length:882 start_codon:yes stop_codon:yes gene_type:complete
MNKQLSQEWFAERKNRITGSIAGAILGMSPFMKPADAMRSMVRAAHGAKSEFKGNIATEYGNRNEANAIWEFERETGFTVEETGFHTSDDWLGASPDGLVNGGVLEVKCPFGLRNDTKPKFKTAAEQPHYFAQMQIEMYCTNTRICYFYQWNQHATKLEVIDRDDVYLEKILGDLIMFYSDFKFESTVNYYFHLRDKTESTIELGDREINAICHYKDAKLVFESAKKTFDDAKSVLIEIAEETQQSKVNLDDIKLIKIKRTGAIAYAKVVKDYLPDTNLDAYKGSDSEYWKVG